MTESAYARASDSRKVREGEEAQSACGNRIALCSVLGRLGEGCMAVVAPAILLESLVQ